MVMQNVILCSWRMGQKQALPRPLALQIPQLKSLIQGGLTQALGPKDGETSLSQATSVSLGSRSF